MSKIIVVTPVKNEAWILQAFLQVTSQFADAILLADQQSEDDTIAIAQCFPKVQILANPFPNYNNANRQYFLIEKARELFHGNNIILALDADELASADSLNPEFWQEIRTLSPGTILYFRKIDIEEGCESVSYETEAFYPLGFVDDGFLEHKGKPMHSVRIPLGNQNQPKVEVKEIAFLHLHRLRPLTQAAKRRFYQVKEKDFKMNPWYWRRYRYGRKGFYSPSVKTKPIRLEWISYPIDLEVSIKSLKESLPIWFDFEVYRILQEKGGLRYWLDNIWDKDWNNFAPGKRIWVQPRPLALLLWGFDNLFIWLYKLKSKL